MTDENHGEGGSYVITPGGERELVERTMSRDDALPEQAPPADQATQTESADADFFSPAAPADQSTAE